MSTELEGAALFCAAARACRVFGPPVIWDGPTWLFEDEMRLISEILSALRPIGTVTFTQWREPHAHIEVSIENTKQHRSDCMASGETLASALARLVLRVAELEKIKP